MRTMASGLVKVRAISGTYVVFLAFDMKEEAAKGLMGFAIQRVDLTEGETAWLRGNKTFPGLSIAVARIRGPLKLRSVFQAEEEVHHLDPYEYLLA